MDVDYSVLNTGRCDINKSVDPASKHLSKRECVSLTVYFFLIKSLEMFVMKTEPEEQMNVFTCFF